MCRWRGGGGGGDQAGLGPAAGGHTLPAAGPQAGRPPLPLPGGCCPHYSSPPCPGDDLLSVFCFTGVLVNTDAVECNGTTV